MASFEDEPVKKKLAPHQLGEDLSTLSIEELADRMRALRAEIARIEAAIAEKRRSRETAAGFFKK